MLIDNDKWLITGADLVSLVRYGQQYQSKTNEMLIVYTLCVSLLHTNCIIKRNVMFAIVLFDCLIAKVMFR